MLPQVVECRPFAGLTVFFPGDDVLGRLVFRSATATGCVTRSARISRCRARTGESDSGSLAGHQDLLTTQRYMHLSVAAIEGGIRLLEPPTRSRNVEK
jgi:hypothetical protein